MDNIIPVILESPYAGHVERNKAYLQLCIRDSIFRGESPFASHQMFTQALEDLNPIERRKGIDLVQAWAPHAMLTVIYTDLGISNGMYEGIVNAKKRLCPIEYRDVFSDISAVLTFFTDGDMRNYTPWEELFARALANNLVRSPEKTPAIAGVVHGACIIVVKADPMYPNQPLVLALEGEKGTGFPGGRVETGEEPCGTAARELLEETGLAVKAGATLKELPVKPTDNEVIAHGYWLKSRDTFGELRASKEGQPVWLEPQSLVNDRPGRPPVRFPRYNAWALKHIGLIKKEVP